MRSRFFVLGLLLVVVSAYAGCALPPAVSVRWYMPEQVAQGQPLYAKYCAGCHGERGQGGANWDRPNADGSYPPQPLDGSGHSWHHSLSSLETTIAEGGTHQGATMPGFSGVLNKGQRLAVVAAFQSFWSDEIYAGWLSRGGL